MDLRMRQTSVLNIWPAFTDVAIAMLLIFLFFLFIQFIANSKLILKIRMEKKAGDYPRGVCENVCKRDSERHHCN